MMLEILLLLLVRDASIIKIDLMIAGDHNFMSKLKGLEEAEKYLKVFFLPIISEISSMDEYISSHTQDWLKFFVTPMRV